MEGRRVNYYEHHIGDYDSATAHLSMLEDGCYSRLLRVYYRTESPLPADEAQVCRLVRAATKPERAIVSALLKEFFHLADDGWHNPRADEVIAQYHERIPDMEAKRGNAKERQRRARQRRAELFDALREAGIVPRYDTPTAELVTLLDRETLRDVTPSVTPPVTRDDTVAHLPLPREEARSKAPAQPAVVDFKSDLFRRWKALPDGGGGAFLNRLFRDHKPEQRVIEAVERTLDEPRADPKAFVVGCLKAEVKADDAYDDLMRSVR